MTRKRKSNYFEDSFDMSCNLTEAVKRLETVFGGPPTHREGIDVPSEDRFDQSLQNLTWRWPREELVLKVEVRGFVNGPVRIVGKAICEEKRNEWMRLRNDAVNPARIARKILWSYIDEEKVSTMDTTIKLYLRVLALISAALAFLPSFSLPRASLSAVIIVYYLVQEYAIKENAIDIRLFVVATGWTVRIQGVIVFIAGLFLLFIFFTITDPIARGLGAMICFLLSWLPLELLGNAPRIRAADTWKYLTSHHRIGTSVSIKSSVDQAAISLADSSKYLLGAILPTIVLIAFLQITASQNPSTELEIVISIIIIGVNSMIILDILRKLRGSAVATHAESLPRDVPSYPRFIMEVNDEEKDKKRFRSSLNPL
jgi:hypothetical protein